MTESAAQPLPGRTGVVCLITVVLAALCVATLRRPIPSSPGEEMNSTSLLDGRLVDVNTAAAGELQLLPGIGSKMADRIVADRAANGTFESIDHLARVSGIGARMVDRLRDHATAGGDFADTMNTVQADALRPPDER